MTNIDVESYLRNNAFPTIWCPGCGHGIVLKASIRAMQKMGWKKDEVIAVSGIGCSSRAPSYVDFCSIQTTHGRAIAFATGMKMSKPDMNVVLYLGDGDCCAIGGNHLIHAAKRNLDMTVIVMNNHIYGMTGGQVSPTTEYMAYTATSVYGNIEPELDVCGVAAAAGASFVARTTAYHVPQMMSLMEAAMKNKGFSLIEVVDPCPTSYGRRNKFKNPVAMYEQLRDNAVSVERAAQMTPEELDGKIITGVLKNEPRNDFCSEYDKLIAKAANTGRKSENTLEISESAKAKEFDRTELRLTGSGGQGLITAGIILAEAAIRFGIMAVHNQSYGPEARGGASRSEVILSKDGIYYPEVRNPDILLAMTQESFDKFSGSVKNNGVIIADTTYVKNIGDVQAKIFACPITELTQKELGSRLYANVAALGMLAYLFSTIDFHFFEEAVSDRVPAAFREANMNALRAGYRWAEEYAHERM